MKNWEDEKGQTEAQPCALLNGKVLAELSLDRLGG